MSGLEIKVPADKLEEFNKSALIRVTAMKVVDVRREFRDEIVAHKCDVYFLEQKIKELTEVIHRKSQL